MTPGRPPAITAVVPPAADPVSLQTALGFSAQGQEHSAVAYWALSEVQAPAAAATFGIAGA
ncbi:hypothetical protein MAHJHV55_51940 [Mycobacterium avium subsp. hominissuis]